MTTQPAQDLQVLLRLSEDFYLQLGHLLLKQTHKIISGYLSALGCGDHPLIGKTLSDFFDPIVEGRNESVVDLK